MRGKSDQVNNPAHYGGAENPYEAIKVIEAWELGFHLGNTVKYISRAGKKDKTKELEDLEKAQWYLSRRIQQLKEQQLKKPQLKKPTKRRKYARKNRNV